MSPGAASAAGWADASACGRQGPVPAEPGERFAFLDQAHYSMVKTNTFNGVPLPSIWLWDSDSDSLEQVKSFGYEDFRDRLS